MNKTITIHNLKQNHHKSSSYTKPSLKKAFKTLKKISMILELIAHLV